MNIPAKKVLKISIPLLLALFFGWYTFSKLPIDDILPYFRTAHYGWISLGVVCGLLSHLSRAYRWKFQLEPLNYTVRFPNSMMAVFITYLANYGIPRSGEVLRAAVLTNYENVPFEKAFGTIVSERVADLIVLMTIVAFTLVMQFDFIFAILQKSFRPQMLILAAIFAVGLFGLLIFYLKRSSSNIAIAIKTFLKGLLEGVLSIFKMKRKWSFIFHTLFIWTMYLMMFYVTTLAVDDLNGISVDAILIAFIAGSFTIAATNGGIFVYPLAIAAAFSLFDIPENPSIAFGWIIWTSQTVMIIIMGSLSFLLLPIYNRNK